MSWSRLVFRLTCWKCVSVGTISLPSITAVSVMSLMTITLAVVEKLLRKISRVSVLVLRDIGSYSRQWLGRMLLGVRVSFVSVTGSVSRSKIVRQSGKVMCVACML